MKSRAKAMKGSSERVDDLIAEDRDKLLEEYRSSGEGRKRAAAIFLVAGGDVARGAGGALASGLLASKGVWIASALLGLAGAGLLGMELLDHDQSESGATVERGLQSADRVEQIPTIPAPGSRDSTAATNLDPIRQRPTSASDVSAGDRSRRELSPSPAGEPHDNLPLHPGEPERRVSREENITTRATLEIESRTEP